MLSAGDLQRMSDLHFHLLLRCAISMSDDGDNAAQFHPEKKNKSADTKETDDISELSQCVN